MTYQVRGLSRRYEALSVLADLDFDIHSGAVNIVLGPSGCGKTTLLNILAGMDRNFSGSCGGLEAIRASYVFQEDRLLPWKNAQENVAFALESLMDKKQSMQLAAESLRDVGLEQALHQYPVTLSGGMKRRVALARAFAYPGELLLLDEPFSALDLKTRIAVMDCFLELHHRFGRTAILVTHDVREAIYLADNIITLSDKPARIRDIFPVSLTAEQRKFTNPEAAKLEARLYSSILS